MKPKVWTVGDPAAAGVARAKLRGLEALDVPYLRASGPGFESFKRGQFREIALSRPDDEDELIQLATHDVVEGHLGPDGSSEVSRIGVRPGKFRSYRRDIDGLFVGNACAIAAFQPPPETDTQSRSTLVAFRTSPSGEPEYTASTRTFYKHSKPWGLGLVSWRTSFKSSFPMVSVGAEIDGLEMLSPSTPGLVRFVFSGWSGKNANMLMAYCKKAIGVTDDYGFAVARPVVLRMRVSPYGDDDALALTDLAPPTDSTAIHSYQSATPVPIKPGHCALLVAEYFQPQRLQFSPGLNPSNPRGRMLIYRSADSAVTFNCEELSIPAGTLPDMPQANANSAAVDNPAMIPQRVAWNASEFNSAFNQRLLDFVSGNGMATSDGAFLWGTSLLSQDTFEYEGIKIFRIVESTASLVHEVKIAGGLAADVGTPRWVDFVYVGKDTILARVRAVRGRADNNPIRLLISKNNGIGWADLDPTGLPSAMTNTNVGMPCVHRIRKNGDVVVYLPVRQTRDDGDFSVIFQSTDGCKTWVKAGTMAKLKGADFIPGIDDWSVESVGSSSGNYNRSYFMGYGRVAVVRDSAGRLLPVDQINPWILDTNYEAPS